VTFFMTLQDKDSKIKNCETLTIEQWGSLPSQTTIMWMESGLLQFQFNWWIVFSIQLATTMIIIKILWFVYVTDVYWSAGPVRTYEGTTSSNTTAHPAAWTSSWTWLLWLVKFRHPSIQPLKRTTQQHTYFILVWQPQW
jgi:hypothetical protein